MRELLDTIETRQQLVRETAERLRDQIARLTEQLTAAEDTLKRLDVTRQTIVELTVEDGTAPPNRCVPDTPRSWPPSRKPRKDSAPRTSVRRWAWALSHGTPKAPAPN
ncbi:hypothetical protein ACH4YO_27675 [Streptomyces noursei]|uniref:hypothetical protein n=1 Tax=Streptomyces noursei TaxID=1971 RepID=UPI0033DF243F